MTGRGVGQWGTVENRGVGNGRNNRTERGGVKRCGKETGVICIEAVKELRHNLRKERKEGRKHKDRKKEILYDKNVFFWRLRVPRVHPRTNA